MYAIGLTGGIASGKSAVAEMLLALGADVIDADQIAREAVRPGCPAWRAIVGRFGEEILRPDQSIDRAKLGEIIFSRAEEKAWLNRTTHPDIENEMLNRLRHDQTNRAKVVVLDVPLLFEAGWDKYADETWVVYVDEQTQLERLMKRNRYGKEQAQRRVRSQAPLAEKVKRADFVIDNTRDLEHTRAQVCEGWKLIKKKVNELDG